MAGPCWEQSLPFLPLSESTFPAKAGSWGTPGDASSGSRPRLPREGPLWTLLPVFCCKRPLSHVGPPSPGTGSPRPGHAALPLPGCRGDCFGWQLQNNLWVTHTFHGRLRSKCLFKGKLGVRRRWIWAASWLSRAWTLRLGGPVGSLGTPAPDLTREQRAGAQGCGCQPVYTRQELSPTVSSPVLLCGAGAECGRAVVPMREGGEGPGAVPQLRDTDVLTKHRGGAHGWPCDFPAVWRLLPLRL